MPVSKEEVIWCYRLLLGREPESRDIVLQHMKCDNRSALVRGFLGSEEFASGLAAWIPRLPLATDKIDVEVDATDSQLARLNKRIRLEWSHLGIERPHFSVLSAPQFLPENIESSITDFWASGEAEVASLERVLERHQFSSAKAKTCVEYGCGVGRVTAALARRFGRVYAYDISPAHLALAKKHLAENRIDNVDLILCAEQSLQELSSCDFFYSCIVFQHNPPPVILRLVETALEALNSFGIAIFQVPSYIEGYQFRLEQYLDSQGALDFEMHCLPQKFVFDAAARSRCEILEVREDGCTGAPHKIISNTFIIRKV